VETNVEQAGAMVSAGLAAAEIDPTSLAGGTSAHASAPGPPCANCGQPVGGRYCQSCGQAAHLHRSLLHLLEELIHNVLHFDAKGWRTLPLLAGRPGALTRRYIDGQRMRYVSPLALFLFSSFLMFFVVSLVLEHAPSLAISPADREAAHADLARDLADAQRQVERATAALAEARRAGHDEADAQEELSSAQTDQRVAEAALKLTDAAITRNATAAPPGAPVAAEAAPITRGLEQLSDVKIDTGHPAIDEPLHRALHNPQLFLYRLENTAYKFLFMLIPISLPFLWLMFVGRPGVAVYDHAVFSLYSLSFMSLLIVSCALLARAGWASGAVWMLFFVPPLHMFLQLRGTYGLGIFAALWRTLALLVVAGTAFLLFLLFAILVSVR
jgi:hypothetical protein